MHRPSYYLLTRHRKSPTWNSPIESFFLNFTECVFLLSTFCPHPCSMSYQTRFSDQVEKAEQWVRMRPRSLVALIPRQIHRPLPSTPVPRRIPWNSTRQPACRLGRRCRPPAMWPEIPLPYATDAANPPVSHLGRKSGLLPAEERPVWLPGRGEEVPPHATAWRRGPIEVSRAGWDRMRRGAHLLRFCWSPLGVERRDSWTGGHCCWVGRGPGPLQRSLGQRLRDSITSKPPPSLWASSPQLPRSTCHLCCLSLSSVYLCRPMPSW